MKKMKKIFALLIAMVMVLGMSTAVFAQTSGTQADGTGSIAINNPTKGESYSVFKLFDATLGANGEVAYKGTVPATMTDYFEETSTGSGYVQAKPAAFKTVKYYTDATKTTESEDPTAYWTGEGMSTGLESALETWAGSATAAAGPVESDGTDPLTFLGLPYGYYVMTTTHEDDEAAKAIISVDTTQPNVTIYDKNTTTPTADKKADGTSYSIGDTITFTATFDTTNYYGSGADAGKIYKYVISDTLPEYLSDVAITSITIGGTAWADAPTAFTNKQITIPWVDDNGKSLYANGAKIVVTYTAKLTSTANVNADNTNTIGITPYDDKDQPYSEPFEDEAVITTYAAALKKTDGTNALAGAKFAFNGLTVEKTADGIYTVVSYDATSTTAGTEMEVDSNGKLYIIGLKQGVTLTGKETEAPVGYNKLTSDVTLSPQVLQTEVYKESGTRYYDAKGNLVSEEVTGGSSKTVTNNLSSLDAAAVEVINEAGSVLPSTGGIGTTIFYVIGAILVIGAGVVLVTRRRMNAN